MIEKVDSAQEFMADAKIQKKTACEGCRKTLRSKSVFIKPNLNRVGYHTI